MCVCVFACVFVYVCNISIFFDMFDGDNKIRIRHCSRLIIISLFIDVRLVSRFIVTVITGVSVHSCLRTAVYI